MTVLTVEDQVPSLKALNRGNLIKLTTVYTRFVDVYYVTL